MPNFDPWATSDQELDQYGSPRMPSFLRNPYLQFLAQTGRLGGGTSGGQGPLNPASMGVPSGGGVNPLNIVQAGVNVVRAIPTLRNILSGGGGGGGATAAGAAGAAGAVGLPAAGMNFGTGGMPAVTALPTGAEIAASGAGALPLAEAGPALAGEAGAGGFLGALAPWAGPLAIGAGILSKAPEWSGGGLGFGASKDQIRQDMAQMGPQAAMQAVLDQANGTVRWRSQSDATSPLGLLDSFGDVFGRDNPLYAQAEENLYRRTVPAGGRDVTEAEIPGILGDARSAGVLAGRGEELGSWRSHPLRPYRYWTRRTPEPEALARDIETESVQAGGSENYSADQRPRLDPALRAAYEERNPDVAARTRARLNPRPLMQAGEA